jgi:glycerol-3-phosphate dehydrogenase
MPSVTNPILILGAGINGAALARELTIEGVPVCVVDTADVAFGATAYSSRLIHGGLRYLEYGEFDLVRESLAERTRLLRLAPQFVKPLELFIPVGNRASGLWQSLLRFLRWERWLSKRTTVQPRGRWLVQLGLWLYDLYARDPALPRHTIHRADEEGMPPINRRAYHWLCSYFDAQIRFPERFVLALLEDARRAAEANGSTFELLTYHQAKLDGKNVEICPTNASGSVVRSLEPAAIVNAAGAWVDETLERLRVPSRTLMGGTKGSHLVLSSSSLREALGDHGLYAEAADGRPVFVLPFGPWSLVGTTDLPYHGDPAEAVATTDEIDYLLATVNHLLPGVRVTTSDMLLHYSGIRPLPASGPTTPAAVTRRHWLEEHPQSAVPMYSVIGGKLTTCRSLADSAATTILNRLGIPRRTETRDRPIPGGERYPHGSEALQETQRRLAEQYRLAHDQVAAIWELVGTRTESILQRLEIPPAESLAGTSLPVTFVRWLIQHEWVTRLDDLVERRLMLLYDRGLSHHTLRQLAALLVETGKLNATDIDREIEGTVHRLQTHFGRAL